MYKKILMFSLLVCGAAAFAGSLTVSGKKVEIEWKNNMVEFRHKESPAKVLIYPEFTNGEKGSADVVIAGLEPTKYQIKGIAANAFGQYSGRSIEVEV